MPRPPRKAQTITARERRLARKQRRDDMLEDVAKGVHYGVIAGKYKISLRTVRREVGRALDQHWIETPQRHIRLQVARLNEALRLIDDAMLDGRVDAIAPLLKVLDRLDRYNALGQPPETPRLLALTHSGHENALKPLESAVPDLSAPIGSFEDERGVALTTGGDDVASTRS